MPIDIDDDAETAFVELAAIYARSPDKSFTGAQIALALRTIAGRLHERRMIVKSTFAIGGKWAAPQN